MRCFFCEMWLQAAEPGVQTALGQVVNLALRLVILDPCTPEMIPLPQ